MLFQVFREGGVVGGGLSGGGFGGDLSARGDGFVAEKFVVRIEEADVK